MTDKKFMTKKDLEGELLELRDRLCGIIDEYAMREKRWMIRATTTLSLGFIATCGASYVLTVNEHPFIAVATAVGGLAGSFYGGYVMAEYLEKKRLTEEEK